jgi:hypothetical protein
MLVGLGDGICRSCSVGTQSSSDLSQCITCSAGHEWQSQRRIETLLDWFLFSKEIILSALLVLQVPYASLVLLEHIPAGGILNEVQNHEERDEIQ